MYIHITFSFSLPLCKMFFENKQLFHCSRRIRNIVAQIVVFGILSWTIRGLWIQNIEKIQCYYTLYCMLFYITTRSVSHILCDWCNKETVQGKLPHHTDKETFCVNTTKKVTTQNEDRLISECIGDDYDIIKSPSGHTSTEQQASYMSSHFSSHNAALCCYFKSDFSVRQSLENND